MCLRLKFVSRLPMKLATHHVLVLGGTGAAGRVTQDGQFLRGTVMFVRET